MRHAKAVVEGRGLDADPMRELSARGQRDAVLMGRWLAASVYWPDEVLCSSALRTRQTLGAILDQSTVAPAVSYLDELYLAAPETLLEVIASSMSERLLLVGHNPGLEQLVAIFGAPAARGVEKFMPTSALYVFQLEGGVGRAGQTSRFLDHMRPSMLRS